MTNVATKYFAEINDAAASGGIHAYRGQQDSQWPLHSGATRRLIQEHGCEVVLDPEFEQLYLNYHREVLVDPARTRGFGTESGRRLSDIEVLAKLQHFGAPTGLLDFTWNPLVALWFACADFTIDGKLYVVDTNHPLEVARVSTDERAQSISDVFRNVAGQPRLSYWEPTATGDASARILGQRSVFVVGRPLIPTNPEIVSEIIVAKEDKEPLQTALEALDVHQESIFQDVYGFAQATNRKLVPGLTPAGYVRRGNRHYQSGGYAEAIAEYSNAIPLDPKEGLIYLLRGNVHAASGEHKAAIDDYDKAENYIARVPVSAQSSIYYNRGNSRAELQDYEGALQDYTEALNIDPTYRACYYNRGNAYADLYRFEDAVLDYDKVADYEQGNAVFNKGNALLVMGRLADAWDCYQDASIKGGDHPGIVANLSTLGAIMQIVAGREYTVNVVSDPTSGHMSLRFGLQASVGDEWPEGRPFLLFGRVGNTGNTGGPGLSGGQGFNGKPFILAHSEVLDTDR